MRSDFVFLEVEGRRIDTWTSYKVDSDLLVPADAFSFELGFGSIGTSDGDRTKARAFAELRDLVAPGARVRVYVGDDVTGRNRSRYLQLSGRITEHEVDVGADGGTVLRVTGRDDAWPMVQSHVPVSLVREQGTSFIALVRAAVAPWSIEVVTDASAARDILTGRSGLSGEQELLVEQARAQGIDPALMRRSLVRRAAREQKPLDTFLGTTSSDRARDRSSSGQTPSDIERITLREARPRPGETVWEYLERHARRLGVMMWMNPRGQLVLGSPHYSQAPLYSFVRRFVNRDDDPNTILGGPVRDTIDERVSRVTVYGRTHGDDVERARVRATASDADMPLAIEHVVHDNDIRTEAEANRRAKRELAEATARSRTVEYALPDHGMGRYLYAVDTMARVVDEWAGIDEAMYVTGRTFMRSRDAGTSTTVRLARRGSIVL